MDVLPQVQQVAAHKPLAVNRITGPNASMNKGRYDVA